MNTLLIAGFGDIARRALPQLLARFAVIALVRPERMDQIPARPGLTLEPGDLDAPETLRRFAGRASHVLHCAPPPPSGTTDPPSPPPPAMLAAPRPPPPRPLRATASGAPAHRAP